MQNNQSHAAENAFLDFVDQGVRHFIVGHVSPPDENIGAIQNFVGQAVFRHVKRHGTELDVLHRSTKRFLQMGVNAFGIALAAEIADRTLRLFVKKLVPNCDVGHGTP